MDLNLNKCLECKYIFFSWCAKRGNIADHDICKDCDMSTGDGCHCLTVDNSDECERFIPKEESDEN